MNDPYELNNLAEEPAYEQVKDEYLNRLSVWRKYINDKGVTEEFGNGGWPANYPTKSLEEWEAHCDGFIPWVLRKPTAKRKTPLFEAVIVGVIH